MTKQPTLYVLEANNLCKNYGGIEAFKNGSFSIKKGETILIFVNNWTRKSSFLKNTIGAIT